MTQAELSTISTEEKSTEKTLAVLTKDYDDKQLELLYTGVYNDTIINERLLKSVNIRPSRMDDAFLKSCATFNKKLFIKLLRHIGIKSILVGLEYEMCRRIDDTEDWCSIWIKKDRQGNELPKDKGVPKHHALYCLGQEAKKFRDSYYAMLEKYNQPTEPYLIFYEVGDIRFFYNL